MLSMISSADLTHANGFGSALWSAKYKRMASSNARVLRWLPRRICRCVRAANQRSTWLIQDE